MSIAEPRDLLHCSFCEKSQKKVKKLIAGPGVYICNECIDLCNDIIDDEFVEDGLGALRKLSARTDQIVDSLKADGVPWDDIAAALRRDDETP